MFSVINITRSLRCSFPFLYFIELKLFMMVFRVGLTALYLSSVSVCICIQCSIFCICVVSQLLPSNQSSFSTTPLTYSVFLGLETPILARMNKATLQLTALLQAEDSFDLVLSSLSVSIDEFRPVFFTAFR